MSQRSFADRVLEWYERHGRHDLPWQKQRTPYRVWVAEIMLQQTQVKTVIPYYERFMQSFPELQTLASATLDEVLEHWAGLGYYSRARNMHKAALEIMQHHRGQFPETYADVLKLPGIGPSTAGAVLAQALGQCHTVLDGNVKRVLCRYHAVEGWPGQPSVEKQLWSLAEQHTPQQRLAEYTQAMMDMGATLCKRGTPRCDDCPLQHDCRACQTGQVEHLPTPRPKKILPVRSTRMLVIADTGGAILLEKRPPTGIWGGLWSLPEIDLEQNIAQACQRHWGLKVLKAEDDEPLRHTFSHFHLDITPCRVHVDSRVASVNEAANKRWCDQNELQARALAAPVARILQQQVSLDS